MIYPGIPKGYVPGYGPIPTKPPPPAHVEPTTEQSLRHLIAEMLDHLFLGDWPEAADPDDKHPTVWARAVREARMG